MHAPHSRSFANGDVPADEAEQNVDLDVVFVSEEDGRESLVDLTKTLCDMAQRGKLSSDDVSLDLVDAEVKGAVALPCAALRWLTLQKPRWTSRIC